MQRRTADIQLANILIHITHDRERLMKTAGIDLSEISYPDLLKARLSLKKIYDSAQKIRTTRLRRFGSRLMNLLTFLVAVEWKQ